MMIYEDLILSICRLSAFYYLIKNHRFAWPLTLSITLYKIFILYQINLKALALSKCINLVISSIAWKKWQQQDHFGTNNPSNILTGNQLKFIWVVCLTIMMIQSYNPATLNMENMTAILSILGYCLAAYRKRECWTAWLIYDCFMLYILVDKKLYMSALTTCLYIPIALVGNMQWKRQSQSVDNKKHTADKQISFS